MPYIDLSHAQRVADQIGAKVTVDGERVAFKIGNTSLGSTLWHEIGGERWIAADAVSLITGIAINA